MDSWEFWKCPACCLQLGDMILAGHGTQIWAQTAVMHGCNVLKSDSCSVVHGYLWLQHEGESCIQLHPPRKG